MTNTATKKMELLTEINKYRAQIADLESKKHPFLDQYQRMEETALRKIRNLLSDGEWHSEAELVEMCDGFYSADSLSMMAMSTYDEAYLKRKIEDGEPTHKIRNCCKFRDLMRKRDWKTVTICEYDETGRLIREGKRTKKVTYYSLCKVRF